MKETTIPDQLIPKTRCEAKKRPASVLVSEEQAVLFRYAAEEKNIGIQIIAEPGEPYEILPGHQSIVPEGMKYIKAGGQDFDDLPGLWDAVNRLSALVGDIDRVRAAHKENRQRSKETFVLPFHRREA